MLQSNEFLEEIIKEAITIEPCKDKDKIQITVNKHFINDKIYDSLECRVKEYAKFFIIENNTEEIARIHFKEDENSSSLLSRTQAKDYSNYLADKINKDIKEILKI